MKIAVCVKQVPDAAGRRIDPQTKRLDRSGEGALNAFDANAVEEALRVREATGDGEVVLVSLGPAKALESLRKALAMG
ncbi:MAG: electron transfer flavoprotein subunit beta, partial [Actinomycetota bacterium]|nr:electron transfer flavoprotein subunit beta [Actinomycetota bacterium]